tara:strand:- start:129 stop:737 length:609 start_codon:yes stop_codon:yes gene_type:complete
MESITNFYKFQITNEDEYKIICVDNDSKITSTYDLIQNQFPNVDILHFKNKNYEWGAYKYAYENFKDFDKYICLQDTIVIKQKIDISIVNENKVYTAWHLSGFYSHYGLKNSKIRNRILKNVNLDVEPIINSAFCLAQHNTFIIDRKCLGLLFETLINPPIKKEDTNFYERLYGMFFILKNIETVNLHPYIIKIPRKYRRYK